MYREIKIHKIEFEFSIFFFQLCRRVLLNITKTKKKVDHLVFSELNNFHNRFHKKCKKCKKCKKSYSVLPSTIYHQP